MKTIFEKSVQGKYQDIIPECTLPEVTFPQELTRSAALELPEISETEMSRHYNQLAQRAYGVSDGMYPLGSCTMKYNPAVNEEVAALKGLTDIHPQQPASTVQGWLRILKIGEDYLKEVTGMDAVTFQPAAGAHGEYAGIRLIREYHMKNGDDKRTKVIVPDSAHGTNPATAAMCGYEVVSVPSDSEGGVDVEELSKVLGNDVAALMLTNPNTLGISDKNILEITEMVHEAGGLCYYDGANLNAILGIARPGDMGFDVMHMNLHKTFSTPHGGGGPGSGAVACKNILKGFLPGIKIEEDEEGMAMGLYEETMGPIGLYYGNVAVAARAIAYMLTLGKEGMVTVAKNAVLNANYMKALLEKDYNIPYNDGCMHEFVISAEDLKKETGITAMDIAKSMIDNGVHPPTVYFPLIVHEALMFEPTETETKESLDRVSQILLDIRKEAYTDPQKLHEAPRKGQIRRPDEVGAARNPILVFEDGKDI